MAVLTQNKLTYSSIKMNWVREEKEKKKNEQNEYEWRIVISYMRVKRPASLIFTVPVLFYV